MQRIAILGPESTGKSTLAAELSAHFHEPWVREYARAYLQQLDRRYVEADLLRIARGQLAEEARAEQAVDQLLFCDTNLLTILIWSEDKFGRIAPELQALWQPYRYDLSLLLYPDLRWESDPQREDPHRLQELFHTYEQALEREKVNFAVIKGQGPQRLQNALWALDFV